MAANPHLKALPRAQEQRFLDTVRLIREQRLTRADEIPDLSKELQEKALALLLARTDFGEVGFWQAYEALAEGAPQLRLWKDLITTAAPLEEPSPEPSDERFLTNSAGKRVLKLSTIEEIYALPDASPLIAGIVDRGAVSLLYGISGTGKTFTGLDLALSISHGLPWQGRAVQQGTVWYLNTEGKRGLKKRLRAWYQLHEALVPDRDHFKIIPWPLDLRAYTQELIETIKDQPDPPTLLVIDNFSMCTPGIDQNKQEQVAPVLHLMNALAAEYGCHILIIHHTNKAGDVNGTMAFRNHVDTMIELVKEDPADRESAILFRCLKARDAEPFEDLRLSLQSLVLAPDTSTREVITSCVVVAAPQTASSSPDGLGDLEKTMLDLLGEETRTYTDWKKACLQELGIAKATFERKRDLLLHKGVVRKVRVPGKVYEGYQRVTESQNSENG